MDIVLCCMVALAGIAGYFFGFRRAAVAVEATSRQIKVYEGLVQTQLATILTLTGQVATLAVVSKSDNQLVQAAGLRNLKQDVSKMLGDAGRIEETARKAVDAAKKEALQEAAPVYEVTTSLGIGN